MLNWLEKLTDSQAWLINGQVKISEIADFFNVSTVDYKDITDNPIKIEVIRALIHWINYKPINSPYKLVFIQNAQNLTSESANALLKTLEEPPSYIKLFLIVSSEAKILPTIKSRCQKIRLPGYLDETMPLGYMELAKLQKLSIKDQFNWAKQTSEFEKETLLQIFNLWETDLHQKLLSEKDVISLIKAILLAKGLLETNISVKLLLENLLINLEEEK